MDRKCEQRHRICDETCDPALGCWGRGPTMCTKCRYWQLNETCVKECPEEGFYQDYTTKQCLPCYEECLTCSGPSERDCTSCRNVQLQTNDELICLANCGANHYEYNKQCKPCHKSCSNLRCTGPGDHLGPGGCSECLYAQVSREYEVIRCLFSPSMHEACRDVKGHYPSTRSISGVQLVHCVPCDEECVGCTSSGRNSIANGCICKDYANEMTKDSICLDKCLDSHYVASPRNGTQPGICKSCHHLCDRGYGCTGPSESECTQCMFATLQGEPNVCLAECPEEFPFLDELRMCNRVDLNKEREKRSRMIAMIFATVFAILVISMLIVCIRCRTFKRKLLKEQISNYVDIPEMTPIDPSIRSNMSRVNLITASELQTKGTQLGAGAFGVVYAGFWFPKGKGKIKVPVAIKLVKGTRSGKEETEMLNEAMQMSSLRHEHLLRLVGICLHEEGIQLVTLLRPLGNLLGFLKKHKAHLCGKDLLLYCYQISSAMRYLYEHRVIHRDLAARNVLVKRHNHVEVTDFGLAKLLDYGQEKVKVMEGKVAIKWLALESLKDQSYTHRTDVWAFGVTCWEILTFGQSPYQGMDICSIKNFLQDGNRLSQPSNCSIELYQVLLQCWMANPESRPTFTMLHERFQNFCRIPHLYVEDQATPQAFIETECQRDLLRELLNDTDNDFTDPLNYFEMCENPETPSADFETAFVPRNVRRLQSTSSHRYQTDPMIRPASARPSELGMDDGNYLIPNAKLLSEHATMYTPVVVNENGGTELLGKHEYYNEAKHKAEYYNDIVSTQSEKQQLQVNEDIAEEVEKESCL
ncbi:Furin-like cysteine rich region [Parelaphostrongylus tenuis]|uniref:Furin-like cysteine rich region n=1 Tax=Parelaphostrongylus tenuis TaxID=148309 RepID=A0AAD5MUQ1_PARTN|nr:Furin-like cysteine rich region [Parelaphostrongylus tenuis]